MTSPAAYEYLIACNGQTFDKAKYPQLAKLFTNGMLPNLNDNRFLEGSTSAGQSKDAGLPQHTHIGTTSWTALDGYLSIENRRGGGDHPDGGGIVQYESEYNAYRKNGDSDSSSNMMGKNFHINAGHNHTFTTGNASNGIYGKSDTVQPKSYTVTYYVCYA